MRKRVFLIHHCTYFQMLTRPSVSTPNLPIIYKEKIFVSWCIKNRVSPVFALTSVHSLNQSISNILAPVQCVLGAQGICGDKIVNNFQFLFYVEYHKLTCDVLPYTNYTDHFSMLVTPRGSIEENFNASSGFCDQREFKVSVINKKSRTDKSLNSLDEEGIIKKTVRFQNTFAYVVSTPSNALSKTAWTDAW